MVRWSVAVLVAAVLVCAWPAGAAPPAPGLGWGKHVRTIDGLRDVRAALIADDGTVVAALGSGGVVDVAPDGTRRARLAAWPSGGVAEAIGLAWLPDGRVAVLDRAAGRVVAAPGGEVLLDASPARLAAVAVGGGALFVADGDAPRIMVSPLSVHGESAAVRWIEVPADALPVRLAGLAYGDGTLLAADAANHRVMAIDPANGRVLARSGDRGAFPDMWQDPSGIGWDGRGFLVTDLLNHRVVRVDARGATMDRWGQHAVRPREGAGKIHYPTSTQASPDGSMVVVAEPFERRVQVFGHLPPPDPTVPRMTELPAFDGVASHFSREMAIDGQTMVLWEPESASALVFDLRHDPPIHVTTLGGPGTRMGQFGQVSAVCIDEAGNRIHLADHVRRVFSTQALVRNGQAPAFDPFMGRTVREVPFPVIDGREVSPIDMVRAPDGAIVVLDAAGPRIVEFDPSFAVVRTIGQWEGDARPVRPVQLALDGDGHVVVVDAADAVLRRYARSEGWFLGAIRVPGLEQPWGVAAVPDVTGAGPALAVTDAAADRWLLVDGTTGTVRARGGSTGVEPGQLWEPSGIAWSPTDARLYVTDHCNHRVQSFALDGQWMSSVAIGRAFVRPRDPQLNGPTVPPAGVPSAAGAADTRASFPVGQIGPDGWVRQESTDGTFVVRFRMLPPPGIVVRDPFDVEVEVLDHEGRPLDGALAFDAAMPHHGHGMNVAPPMRAEGPGRWRVSGALFHMPGYWELYFDRTDPATGARSRAQWSAVIE